MSLDDGLKSILIVDDEHEILQLNRQAFEFSGFKVYSALTVDEAILFLKNHKIDYVLSDYLMPNKSGLDLLKIIRHELSLKTPFSFLTAHADVKPMQLVNLSVQNVFYKPTDIDEIIDHVELILKSK